MNKNARTWRDLLSEVLSDPQEKQRVAVELGVHPATLWRWIAGESSPRTHSLRLLLNALPTYRDELSRLLEEEFPELLGSLAADSAFEYGGIPSFVYKTALDLYAMPSGMSRFESISDAVVQHALKQLAVRYEMIGLAISFVSCMPPNEHGMVRSLRERFVKGTPLWKGVYQGEVLFGAESLAGYAVSTGKTQVVADLRAREQEMLPAYEHDVEASAMAAPIQQEKRVAGCLLVSSTLPNYFTSAGRVSLVQDYAALLALAFEPGAFYPLERLELGILPPHERQRSLLSTLRSRTRDIMREAGRKEQSITLIQAEQMAWQQIEAELLQEGLVEDTE